MEKHPLTLPNPPHHTPTNILNSALQNSSTLFNWTEFEIILPPSHFEGFDVSRLFLVVEDVEGAEWEESFHEPKHLTHNQLEEVKRRGTLTINSSPTQPHPSSRTYKLSPLLQKGREIAYSDFLNNVAFALARILFTHIPVAMTTVTTSLTKVGRGIANLLDLLLGLPATETKDMENKIHFERRKYLVAELKSRVGLDYFGKMVTRMVAKQQEIISDEEEESPVTLPFQFQTPSGGGGVGVALELDFGLWDRTTPLTPILTSLLAKTNSLTPSWFLQTREKIVRSLGDNPSQEFHANKLIYEEYLTRLISEIYNCEGIVSGRKKKLLVDQVRVWSCLRGSLDDLHFRRLPEHKRQEIKKLQNAHSFLSRDKVWLKRKEEEIEARFYSDNKFTPHQVALEEMRKKGLAQGAYFCQRDAYFLRETAPALQKILLTSQKQPCRTYAWTVSYRTEPLFNTTTSPPLHRLLTLFSRYLATTLSLLFLVFLKLPLDSSLSLATLYKKQHSSSSGQRYKTIPTRLESTWRRVSKERSKFDENKRRRGRSGDNLFISLRRWERFCNIVIWYGYGVAMTMVWVSWGFIILVVNLGCLIVGGSGLVWPLFYTLGYSLFCIFIRDLDGYHDNKNQNFPIFGIIFGIVFNLFKVIIGIIAIIACPLGSGVVLFVSTLTYTLRSCYDYLIFTLLLKNHARIPIKSSFLIKLQEKTPKFYSIPPKQALLILLTRLELETLTHYERKTLKTLTVPMTTYENFFTQFLQPFSCSLNENVDGFYRDLVKETFNHRERLDLLINERRRKLLLPLPRGFIKISEFENEFCLLGVAMVTAVYKKLIQDYELVGFFSGKGLEDGDFEGLFLSLIVDVFGEEVLYGCHGYEVVGVVPTCLQVPEYRIEPLSRRSFSLTRCSYAVHPPFVTGEVFDVVARATTKCKSRDLLCNPLPVMHPVLVSLLILTREGTFSLDLNDTDLGTMLRELENTTGAMVNEDLSDDDSSSSSSTHSEEEETEENIVMNRYSTSV